MNDIPSFFIDQRIDQLSDERSIKRAYAKALKCIDQETELEAFQALRESYEYAVNWTRHRLWQEQQAATNEAVETAEVEVTEPTAELEQNQTPRIVPASVSTVDHHGEAETPWCDTVPLHSAPESSKQNQEECATPAALPTHDPVEQAKSALQDLLNRIALDEKKIGYAEAELAAMLDDERLINVETRDYFEWVLAGHLAQGWQPGNGDLFGAAVKCFGWNEDKYRILRFGDLGYHINNGLIELSAFNAQNAEAITHQLNLIRRGRETEMPDKRFIRDHILMVEAMVERYPTWLAMVSSRDNIQAWRDAADQYKIARTVKVAVGKKSKQDESFWSGFGWMFFILVLFFSSSLRQCGPNLSRTDRVLPQAAPSYGITLAKEPELDAREAFSLGQDHYFGRNGTAKNEREAALFWEYAAKQGQVDAQLQLGKLYRDANSELQDMSASHFWLEKAASKGKGTLETILLVAEDLYVGRGVKKDAAAAYPWYMKAIERNSGLAHFRVASMLETGGGIKADASLAFDHYLKSANLNFARAQGYLGVIFLEGKLGQTKDEAKGLEWINLAANRLDSYALFVNGEIAEYGLYHSSKNLTSAVTWYKKALDVGNVDAKLKLETLCKKSALKSACVKSDSQEKIGA